MIGLCSLAVIELVILFSLVSADREERATQREQQTQVNAAQISENVQSAFTPTPAPSPIVFDGKEELIQAVATGDYVRGHRAEIFLGENSLFTYENLSLMARILEREAGVNWPDDPILKIGKVVMNRVYSALFPDTIEGVLYQTDPVQYEPVFDTRPGREWDFIPSERYVRLAWRVLSGECSMDDPDVIWQALFPQGTEIVDFYTDPVLGTTTYFCK